MIRVGKSVLLLGAAFVSLLAVRCAPLTPGEQVGTTSAALAGACASTTTCADHFRTCADIGGQARCGACIANYVESAARTCEPQRTCATLTCAPNQACQETPSAFCAEACTNGYVWDRDSRSCRLPKQCDVDVICGANQQCRQTATTDAECFNAICPGQGWDPVKKACSPCAGGNPPVCGVELDGTTVRPGETGNILSVAGGQCVCETRDNYFVPPGITSAVACDADGDGWVNDGAQGAIESGDTNARCHVRRVGKILLQTDDGTTNDATAEDLRTTFGALGLPLYESGSNDGATTGATGAPPGPYGSLGDPGSSTGGKAINSLTKACVGLVQDFNANGVEDVDEDQTANFDDILKKTKVGANAGLLSYYKAYARYSYFLEMESGWYEPPTAAGQLGTYRVQERRRMDDPSAAGLPVKYLPGTPDYWRECQRHADVLYSTASTHVGGDFTGAGLGTFAGAMGHESQFKCVIVHQDGQYPAGANETTRPQSFDVSKAGKLERKGATETFHDVNWVVNTCNPRGVSSPGGLSTTNPLIPNIDCTPGWTPDGTKTTVAWAAVPDYEYDSSAPPVYQRGCVDMCLEPANGGCDPAGTCDAHLGGRTCGCKDNYTLLPVKSQIQIRSDSMCFDDWAWSTTPGNPIKQWSCEDTANFTAHFNQIWEIVPTDNGWVQIRNNNSHQCLEVQNASNASGAAVVQNPCTTSNDQQFLVHVVDGQYFQLNPRHTFMATVKCLGVDQSSTAGQAAIVQTDCSSNPSTMFAFKQPADGTCRFIDGCQYNNGGCGPGTVCKDDPAAGLSCGCDSAHVSLNGKCVCPMGKVDQNGTCVDACGLNNGGCDANATCYHARNHRVVCMCNEGYAGSGTVCHVNPCASQLNNRCSEHAWCTYQDPGAYTCACHNHYSGDGFSCAPDSSSLPHRGGDGGPYFGHNECNAGDFAVGVFGRAGDYINRLGLYCAHLNPDGMTGDTYRTGPWGADQGADFEAKCDPNMIVTGLHVNSHTSLDGMSIVCGRAPYDGTSSNVKGPVGGGGGQLSPVDGCPSGQAVYSINVHTGSWVDSEDAYCRYALP